MSAEVRYANSGDAYIAFQEIGGGARDLLVVMEGFIPIDTMDDEPRLARAMARLGSFARVLRFDRRGIGLSDPVAPAEPPTLEQWVRDGLAVLDAAGSTEAVVLASAEAGSVGLLLAATHPERVSALVIVNGSARTLEAPDYPEGVAPEFVAQVLDSTEPAGPDAGLDVVSEFAPSAAHDAQFREWWEQTGRRGASPATARALLRVALESDVRPILDAISVPTLIVHFAGHHPARAGHYLADRIPDAHFVENRFRIDMPQYIEWYLAGRLKLDELVSAVIPLERINDGFAALRGGEVARQLSSSSAPPHGSYPAAALPRVTVRSRIPSVARSADSGMIGKISFHSGSIIDQS